MRRFGPFTFDAPRRQVFRADGTALHLTRKAFDLLALLVAEAPRVVTKAELHKRLWPGTFVSDAAVVKLVKELRHILRVPGSSDSYIRTSHGVGYAFAGTIAADAPGRAASVAHWVVASDRRVPLQEGENVIGRDPSSHVPLDTAGVSRRHARIVVDGDNAHVEDLGSKNGTAVQGAAVTERRLLIDGDRLTIGPATIYYRSSGAGISTETNAT